MRLIDETAYQYKIAKIPMEERTFVRAWETAQNMPTIDAVPVVRGEWKLYGNDDDLGMSYWCSECNFQLSEDLFYTGYKNGKWIKNGVFKYCPNCGAKMEDKPCE